MKQRSQVEVPQVPTSPTNSQGDAGLKRRISELESELAQKETETKEFERMYQLYKGKWDKDEDELRGLKRRLDEVSFEL